MTYFHRNLLDKLKRWIDRREIYAIKGPRQSGKTTLLEMLQEYLIKEKGLKQKDIIFLNFEDREIMEKFSVDPKRYIKSLIPGTQEERLYILIDEFQYLPDGGQKLKLLYDTFENIKFIITGSSSLELTGKTAKFLVGRVFSFYLYQMDFAEFVGARYPELIEPYREVKDYVRSFIFEGKEVNMDKDIFKDDFIKAFEEYVIFGGYPEVVKTQDEQTKYTVIKNIYDTYVSRDIIDLLRLSETAKLKKIIELLANQTGRIINYNSLAADAQSYFNQIKHYLSILEETFVITPLRPFYTNRTTELKKNPKVYFVDTGFRNYILNNFNGLNVRPDTGSLIENAALAQLRGYQEEPVRYWRTTGKAEVDFIMRLNNEIIPAEVKYATFQSPKISRGFRSFLLEYKPQRAVVATRNFWGRIKIDSTKIEFVPAWSL